jgi:hypothetical protein
MRMRFSFRLAISRRRRRWDYIEKKGNEAVIVKRGRVGLSPDDREDRYCSLYDPIRV